MEISDSRFPGHIGQLKGSPAVWHKELKENDGPTFVMTKKTFKNPGEMRENMPFIDLGQAPPFERPKAKGLV